MGKIEFRSLSFSYPGCENKALDDINIEIGNSEFVLVCGKSGCGKSTLLRQMKKNLIPFGVTDGEVLYCGEDVSSMDDRRNAEEIGFVLQNPDNQIVTDKVWHELAFGLENLGYPNDVIRRRVSEMASFFGIQTWFRKKVSELSGGQKQLLNLASIMAMQPKVIILDEPTSQLDPILSMEFLETLKRINRELGTTIIISEHRLEEVFPMADQVIVMDEGRVLIKDNAQKVAEFLGENKNVMYQGLPTAMKVYAQVKPEGQCPVTVRDGRLWLEKIFDGKTKIKSLKELEEKRGSDGSEEKKITKEREILIKLEDVWFRYDRKGVDIVKGLSLDVQEGDFYCIVGGNGVGKSTTIKVINGLLTPYRGKVYVGGKNPAKDNLSFPLGTLPQNPQSLFTEITVEEELYEALFETKLSHKEKLAEVDGMLKELSLDHLKKSHPYDLSGGEQQRLALGKVLLLKPKVLLLDEPTKGLDPYFKIVLADILNKLNKNGVTILMVTHDIEFAAEYADRCAMIFDGDIVSKGEPRAFFNGNSFYTTAANRMSRNIFEGAVTCQDVIELCHENLM